MPTSWYNIQADLPKPLPPVLHPGTMKVYMRRTCVLHERNVLRRRRCSGLTAPRVAAACGTRRSGAALCAGSHHARGEPGAIHPDPRRSAKRLSAVASQVAGRSFAAHAKACFQRLLSTLNIHACTFLQPSLL